MVCIFSTSRKKYCKPANRIARTARTARTDRIDRISLSELSFENTFFGYLKTTLYFGFVVFADQPDQPTNSSRILPAFGIRRASSRKSVISALPLPVMIFSTDTWSLTNSYFSLAHKFKSRTAGYVDSFAQSCPTWYDSEMRKSVEAPK